MESFNYIRNKISEYTKKSLLDIAVKVLKNAEKNPSPGFPLFSVLTLIKWTIVYGENKYPPKIADYSSFEKLYKCITDLESNSRILKNGNSLDIYKLLVVIAHQQFWLQDELYMTVIHRQLVLYNSLKSKYDLNLVFKERTGLEIIDFFKIAFIIYAHINPEKIGNTFYYSGIISSDWIKTIDEITSVDKRKSFFKLLTFGTADSIERIKKDSAKLKSKNLQAFDNKFFSQYPIFFFSDNFFVLHKALFPNTIRHYIYDFLKESDPNFSEEFGRRLEKYIYLGLKETELDTISETEFKKLYPNCKKQVDFIIKSNILIESKAIELATLPSVYPEDSILFNSLKDSVVKAYVNQMITVANHVDKSKTFYGLIITYKKLYLGSGRDCWDAFLKSETERFCKENKLKMEVLPPENLFFVDIDTWDVIVQLIVDKKIILQDLFEEIKQQDSNLATKKFHFKMYLEKYFPININLSFIKKEADQFLN